MNISPPVCNTYSLGESCARVTKIKFMFGYPKAKRAEAKLYSQPILDQYKYWGGVNWFLSGHLGLHLVSLPVNENTLYVLFH